MSKAGIQGLVQNRLELLYHESYGKVAITIELHRWVYWIDLEGPFTHIDNLVSKIAKFNVTKVPSELIDALFRENSFDKVVAITDENLRNDLDYDQSHVSLECRRHLQVLIVQLVVLRITLLKFIKLSIELTITIQVVLKNTLELGSFKVLCHF